MGIRQLLVGAEQSPFMFIPLRGEMAVAFGERLIPPGAGFIGEFKQKVARTGAGGGGIGRSFRAASFVSRETIERFYNVNRL